MECDVVGHHETEGFRQFYLFSRQYLCRPLEVPGDNGKLDYTRLKPVLFEFPTYSLHRHRRSNRQMLENSIRRHPCALKAVDCRRHRAAIESEVYP